MTKQQAIEALKSALQKQKVWERNDAMQAFREQLKDFPDYEPQHIGGTYLINDEGHRAVPGINDSETFKDFM